MALDGSALLPGQYLSIAKGVDAEATIQRSRFIASLRKVRNRGEIDAALKEVAAAYARASHYCWAYRLAGDPVLEHASDAGEPPGTAGRPILGALKRHSLGNILAVVTRYYGGVKLGVKGLIAAYGGTTLLAIEGGRIVVEEPSSRLTFRCAYDLYNILLARLERASVDPAALRTDFSEEVSGEATIPNSLIPALRGELDAIRADGRNFDYAIRSASD